MNVTLQSAKMIGAGLATIGLTGVGAGVGIVFIFNPFFSGLDLFTSFY